jgi:hypothetical protein
VTLQLQAGKTGGPWDAQRIIVNPGNPRNSATFGEERRNELKRSVSARTTE